MKTVTRLNIAEMLYQEVGLSRKESGEILDLFLTEIVEELSKGRSVKLSSFGTFALRDKKSRVGRNPKTGAEAEITPRRVISFKPSQFLRNAVNGIAGGRVKKNK